MAKRNGGIIGPSNVPTGQYGGTASGVWRLRDAFNYIKAGLWPGSASYPVANSLRFNSASSDYLNKTSSSSPTNNKIATFSAWVKRSSLGSGLNVDIFDQYTDGSNYAQVMFYQDNILLFQKDSGSDNIYLLTTQVFRDISAWYHIVVAYDTTQATSSNRVKLYINGSQVTSFSTATYPSQNLAIRQNSSSLPLYIGTYSAGNYYGGYMSDVALVDGQALTPSSFGKTDSATGIWTPLPFTGTFGTNGFFLKFQDSSALGDDTSGNGNDFTVNNLTSVDQSTDTPTNNFATYNPLMNKSSGVPTMSNGNLTLTTNACEFGSVSSIGASKGKWYCELKWDSGLYAHIGITGDPITLSANATPYAGITADSWGWNWGGTIQNNGSVIATYSSFATSDILGIALDLDNNKLYFSKNGTFQNSADPSAGTNGISITASSGVKEGNYFIFIGNGAAAGNATISGNFGNPPYTGGSYTDGAGFGNFSYAVPSGYYALNTKNLANFG